MHLLQLSIRQFKNHGNIDVHCVEGFICLSGQNGTGKTNLIDAIHYLCLGKSHQSLTDQQLIQHDHDFFRLTAKIRDKDLDHEVVAVFQNRGRKEFSCDGIIYEKLSDHIGRFPCVFLGPDDILLINGYSDVRRRFMDLCLSQSDPVYLNALSQHKRILAQRNNLLKDDKFQAAPDFKLLDSIDETMVSYGLEVLAKRSTLVRTLMPFFREYHERLSLGREQISMTYKTEVKADSWLDQLKECRKHDLILRRSTLGIHHDDLVFELEGFPVRKLGSQGQKKTFLTALKLSQLDYIREKLNRSPFLLLDDVFDKFDRDRMHALSEVLEEEKFGQVFITDTRRDRLEELFAKSKKGFQSIHLGS